MTTFADIVSRAFHIGLDTSIKSGVILALAVILTALARGSSAATRHRVWCLALTSCLLMPVVCLLLPQIQIPILPPSQAFITPSPIPFADSPPAVMNHSHSDAPLRFEPIQALAESPSPTPSRKLSEVSPNSSPMAWPNRAATATPLPLMLLALLGGWSVGVLAIWSALIVAIVHIRRRLIRSTPAPSAWLDSLDDIAAILGFSKTVHVLCDPDSTIPLATGLFHPVVLMPHEAENWSFASRRYALLHELAHVERRDVLWQFIGQLVAGLYWFNPLVWFAIRRLRIEREWACDDRVVQMTGRASDYATQLVEIARSARSLSPMIPAVAMAQASDLEHRLVVMFDRARSHSPLSRRAALRLTIAATTILLLLAAIKPVARVFEDEAKAQTPTKKSVPALKETPAQDSNQGPKQEATKPLSDRAKMQVKVVDQTGKPIVGAKIHASIWDLDPTKRGDFPNRDYAVDESGLANIERPRELRILRLWASHPDFVCLFTHWEEGEHDNGRLLPAEFTFTLPKGIEIGGQIVDEAGKPVEGVRVEATLRDDSPVAADQPNVLFNTWLATQEDAAVSDHEGHWLVKNVPANFDRDAQNRVSLRFNHPEFLPIPGDGPQAIQPSFASDALRAQTLRTTLKSGFRLEGVVRDPSGKPVAGALVIRGDDPYGQWGSQEVVTDDQGHYRLPALPSGKLTVTVVAKGWGPLMVEFNLDRDGNKLNFELGPGRPLNLKIVEPSGKPVSKCYVSVQEWRGKKSLYNYSHPNVINSGIPRRANDQGIYTWDWAPGDAVKYQIGTPGFIYQQVELTATGDQQMITLQPEIKISGTVTDAVSGKSIPRFAVHPTLIFRKDFYGQDNQDVTSGVEGRFSLKLDRTDVSYCLLIEADGYRAAVGQPFHITSGDHREDFKLQTAPLLKGRILDLQGRPLKGVQVHLATVVRPLQYNNENDFMGRPPYVTDDGGRFQFVPQTGPYKLVALHAQGYLRLDFDQDAQPGDIQLQPWAHIKGTLWQEGRPVPNATILVQALREKAFDQYILRESRQVRTDAAGHFVFAKIPPERIVIRPLLRVWEEYPITSSRQLPLDLKPGEMVDLDFGGKGAQITGRVVLKGDVPQDFDLNYSLNYLIRRGSALPPPAELRAVAKNAQQGWSESLLWSAEGERSMELYERHFVRLRPDGHFLVNGVAPGEYDFAISVYERPQGCLIDPIAIQIVPVVITKADVDRGSIPLPDIAIPFPERAKIGEPLPEITLRLSNGEAMSLAQFRGKPLLIHGWATWCEPCVKALPKLKSLRASFPAEKLSIVGLNLDEVATDAGEFATKENLSWDHAYVGNKSAAARRLGLSSVPNYLIVSPDGRLMVRTTDWTSAEAELRKLLSP